MNIPSDLYYTSDHEWIKINGKAATVGITDFAQGELGDIVFVEIESLDEKLEKGQTFGTIEAVKTVSDLFMPVSGKVTQVNEKINDNPDIVNSDPYGEGWMIKIEVNDPGQVKELLTPEEYEKLVNA